MEDLNAWKLVLPRDSHQATVAQCHELPQAGHLGVEKTHHRLMQQYYWPHMLKSVVKYVRQCKICQLCKVENAPPRGFMGNRVIEEPWTTVEVDVMGPLTASKSGHCYVLVLQDLFTKWIEVIPLRRATGKIIRDHIENVIISRWGTPRVLFSDNGTEIVNKDLRALAELTGMRLETSPPYHPQANPVE